MTDGSSNMDGVGDVSPAPRAKRRKVQLRRRNLPLLLLKARDGVAGYFRPIFKAHGLTEQQWRVLRSLYENGESSIGNVARRCHILGPSLTGMLERMASAGMLVQRIDDSDLRRSFVSLTKLGRTTFEEMVPQIEEAYAVLEARVGSDELQELYRRTDELVERLGLEKNWA